MGFFTVRWGWPGFTAQVHYFDQPSVHYRKLGWGKRPLKVGECLPLALMQLAGDLMSQNVPAPTVLDCSAQIPLARFLILEPIQQHSEMAPRQKCHKLWHYFRIRPSLG